LFTEPDLPPSAAWQKQVSRPKGLTEADVRERKPTDPSLVCPIDNRLFRDAVKTPCCEKAYCEECIQTHLLEHDFVCPNCQKKIASLDKVIINKPLRTKVGDYIDKAVEESRKEAEAAGSGTPTQTTLTTEAEEVSCAGFCDPLLSLNTLATPGPLDES
jgi:protein MPE1